MMYFNGSNGSGTTGNGSVTTGNGCNGSNFMYDDSTANECSPLSKAQVMCLPSSTSPLAVGVDASPNRKPPRPTTQDVPRGLQGRFASHADMKAQIKRFLLSCEDVDEVGNTMC